MAKKYELRDFLIAGVTSSAIGGMLVGLVVLFATHAATYFGNCTPDIWCNIHGFFGRNSDLMRGNSGFYFMSIILTTFVFLGLFMLCALPVGLIYGTLYAQFVLKSETPYKNTPHYWGICGVFIGFGIAFLHAMLRFSWSFQRFFSQYNPNFFGLSHYGFICIVIILGSIFAGYIAGYFGGKRLQNFLSPTANLTPPPTVRNEFLT